MSQTMSIEFRGESRSFPSKKTPFQALAPNSTGAVLIIAGDQAGQALEDVDASAKAAILVELSTECLGVHTGEYYGKEGSKILCFARFRLGKAGPSNLVEVVRQPATDEAAIAAAREVLEEAGLKVAVCLDFPGRIVDRLIRPIYNSVLRRLDEGLAEAEHMDTTMRLGLGYPVGLVELLEKSGLAEHYMVTQSLYEALGDPAYCPARRARVAKMRQDAGKE